MHQNKKFMTTQNFKPKFNGQRFPFWVITKQLWYPLRSILTPITPYYLLAKLCWMDVHARTLQRSRNKAQLRCAAVRTVRECSPFWQTDSRDYRLPSFLLYVRWVYGQKVLVFRLTVSNLFFVPFFKVLCHPF